MTSSGAPDVIRGPLPCQANVRQGILFLLASTVVFLNVSFNVSICLIPFISFNCFLRRDATLSMVLLSCISGSLLLMILIQMILYNFLELFLKETTTVEVTLDH